VSVNDNNSVPAGTAVEGGNTLLPDRLSRKIGEKLGTSSWVTITQQMISDFGRLTNDPDPMHMDPDWCRENSPFGKPISFGFLTMSLLTGMHHEVLSYAREERTTESFGLNYGFNRLRLVEPVPVDSRIRGHFWVQDVTQRREGEYLMTVRVEVEIEGIERPALVGEWLAVIVEQQGHERLAEVYKYAAE
jgi:acyl dehydratase